MKKSRELVVAPPILKPPSVVISVENLSKNENAYPIFAFEIEN
jgi:hypothetical protein